LIPGARIRVTVRLSTYLPICKAADGLSTSCWALPMVTLERMRNPAVLCKRPSQPPVLTGDRFPHSLPRNVSHHRPARARARAADALCYSGACSSRRSATKQRVRSGNAEFRCLGSHPK
jgi:hypothetical protein